MQETLTLLEKLQGRTYLPPASLTTERSGPTPYILLLPPPDSLPRVQYWYLRGKALNITPDYSPVAEECLSRAVKHDPSLVDAWNCLGESYWKAGNVQQAHDCFTGSLAHVRALVVVLPYFILIIHTL